MPSEANIQEGIRCFKKAKTYSENEADIDKAERLCSKALRMLPTTSIYYKEAQQLLEKLQKAESSQNSSTARSHQNSKPSEPSSSDPSCSTDTNLEAKCRSILSSRDYYKILGVSRNASQEDIKKAYRKLALQFHPDKAKCQSAESAFKEISKSYQCLSNAEAKKYYDTHGLEESAAQYREEYYESHFMTAEELFESFFGGHLPRNRRYHTRTFHMSTSQQQFQSFNLLQLLPFIILIAVSMFSSFFNTSNQLPYSFSWSSSYNIAKTTHQYSLLYYVKSNFFDSYPEGSKKLQDLETQIEMNYYSSECSHDLEKLFQELQTLRFYGSSSQYKNKIEEIRRREEHSSSCQKFKLLKRQFPKLYNSLSYSLGQYQHFV